MTEKLLTGTLSLNTNKTILLMEAERSYHFDHWLHVSKLAMPSDFMHTFYDFLHAYSPWVGADNPLGPTFWCQQECLITLIICSTSDFIDSFSWFNKCIKPQLRDRQPPGDKILMSQKPLVTSVICYTFQKHLFEVWFYTHFSFRI